MSPTAAPTTLTPLPARQNEPLKPEGGNDRGHHDNGHGHGEDQIDLNIPTPRPLWVVVAGLIGIAALIAMLLTGLIPRHQSGQLLATDANDALNAPILVNVATPRHSPATMPITVPGTLRPWQEVSIFARTTGYLNDYYVDISEPIEKGKTMAIIDTPEVEQELGQANAALQQSIAAQTKAKADRDLAKITRDRYLKMRETQGVTLQQLDEKEGALSSDEASLLSAEANIAAAKANVRRLEEMKSFQEVKAPFSGVVTGRAYDRGSLITANPTATDVKPLFKIAQNDVLRAFVNVPQSSALEITKGMEVIITAHERPGVRFPGTVMGTTNYLDPGNRSLLTEVKLVNKKRPNGEFALLPGMYVQATFTVTRDTPPLMIPAPSLINNADGTQVAILQDGKVHFVKIVLGRDFGSDVEVVEGLNGDEKVITNPGERTIEGAAASAGS